MAAGSPPGRALETVIAGVGWIVQRIKA